MKKLLLLVVCIITLSSCDNSRMQEIVDHQQYVDSLIGVVHEKDFNEVNFNIARGIYLNNKDIYECYRRINKQ